MRESVFHVLFIFIAAASLPVQNCFEHDLRSTVDDLAVKLSSLESELTAYRRESRARRAALKEQVHLLMNETNDHEQSLRQVEGMDLVKRVARLETDLTLQNNDHSDLLASHNQSQLTNQTKVRSRVKRQNKNSHDSSLCAFSMTYTMRDEVKLNKYMKFTIERINVGNHYSAETGVFTAPRSGVYVFSIVIGTMGPGESLTVSLLITKSPQISSIRVGDSTYGDVSGSTVLIRLKALDIVRPGVTGHSEDIQRGLGPYCTFSGFLLYEDY